MTESTWIKGQLLWVNRGKRLSNYNEEGKFPPQIEDSHLLRRESAGLYGKLARLVHGVAAAASAPP